MMIHVRQWNTHIFEYFLHFVVSIPAAWIIGLERDGPDFVVTVVDHTSSGILFDHLAPVLLCECK